MQEVQGHNLKHKQKKITESLTVEGQVKKLDQLARVKGKSGKGKKGSIFLNKDGKVKKLNALAKQVVKLPPFTTLKMCPDIKDNYVYDPAKGYYKQASEPLLQQKIYQLFECPFEGYISIMFLLRKFWVKCYLSKRSLEKKLLRTLGMSAFSL